MTDHDSEAWVTNSDVLLGVIACLLLIVMLQQLLLQGLHSVLLRERAAASRNSRPLPERAARRELARFESPRVEIESSGGPVVRVTWPRQPPQLVREEAFPALVESLARVRAEVVLRPNDLTFLTLRVHLADRDIDVLYDASSVHRVPHAPSLAP